MRDNVKTILEEVRKLNEKKRGEAQNLESKIAEIDEKITELQAAQEEAAQKMDFEKGYEYKREADRLKEERGYYLDGIRTLESGKVINGETFQKYDLALRSEFYKEDAATIKKVYALLNEVLKIVEDHDETCGQLDRARDQITQAAGEKPNPSIVSSFTAYIKPVLQRAMAEKRRFIEE